MTQPIWQEIHHFWFKECTADDWFGKSLDFDRLIWQRFGLWCEAAARGECYDWRHNLTGRLTEIVVLDQFSRNVWRDSPRAFSQDGKIGRASRRGRVRRGEGEGWLCVTNKSREN